MKLNVEINAQAGSWKDDDLRRRMKTEILNAVDEAITAFSYGELNSLRFVVPKPKRRRKKVTT